MLVSQMPTVLRFGGLRVVVYPNDHRPPHVHVISGGCEAVFRLNCPTEPIQLRENYGFPPHETAGIAAGLLRRLEQLCSARERIHDLA